MTGAEFREGYDKLKFRWPRAFGADQSEAAYNALKGLSGEDFSLLVKHAVISQKSPPTIAELVSMCHPLGLRLAPSRPAVSHNVSSNGDTYHIRDNVYANDRYVFVRGNRVADCYFIIKKDAPQHPLVQEDDNFRRAGKHLESAARNTAPKRTDAFNSYLKEGIA